MDAALQWTEWDCAQVEDTPEPCKECGLDCLPVDPATHLCARCLEVALAVDKYDPPTLGVRCPCAASFVTLGKWDCDDRCADIQPHEYMCAYCGTINDKDDACHECGGLSITTLLKVLPSGTQARYIGKAPL